MVVCPCIMVEPSKASSQSKIPKLRKWEADGDVQKRSKMPVTTEPIGRQGRSQSEGRKEGVLTKRKVDSLAISLKNGKYVGTKAVESPRNPILKLPTTSQKSFRKLENNISMGIDDRPVGLHGKEEKSSCLRSERKHFDRNIVRSRENSKRSYNLNKGIPKPRNQIQFEKQLVRGSSATYSESQFDPSTTRNSVNDVSNYDPTYFSQLPDKKISMESHMGGTSNSKIDGQWVTNEPNDNRNCTDINQTIITQDHDGKYHFDSKFLEIIKNLRNEDGLSCPLSTPENNYIKLCKEYQPVEKEGIQVDTEIQPMTKLQPSVRSYGGHLAPNLRYHLLNKIDKLNSANVNSEKEENQLLLSECNPTSMGNLMKATYWDYWLAKKRREIEKQTAETSAKDKVTRCARTHYDPEMLLAQACYPVSLKNATFDEYSSQVCSTIIERSAFRTRHSDSAISTNTHKIQTDPDYTSDPESTSRIRKRETPIDSQFRGKKSLSLCNDTVIPIPHTPKHHRYGLKATPEEEEDLEEFYQELEAKNSYLEDMWSSHHYLKGMLTSQDDPWAHLLPSPAMKRKPMTEIQLSGKELTHLTKNNESLPHPHHQINQSEPKTPKNKGTSSTNRPIKSEKQSLKKITSFLPVLKKHANSKKIISFKENTLSKLLPTPKHKTVACKNSSSPIHSNEIIQSSRTDRNESKASHSKYSSPARLVKSSKSISNEMAHEGDNHSLYNSTANTTESEEIEDDPGKGTLLSLGRPSPTLTTNNSSSSGSASHSSSTSSGESVITVIPSK